MIIFKFKNWRVDKVQIPQTRTNNRDEFFVDDVTGKNHYVAKSLYEAKRWILTRGVK